MESSLSQLSIIIPLKPGEDLWRGLLSDLIYLPAEAEIHLVGSEVLPERQLSEERNRSLAPIYFHLGKLARAPKLNFGASKSKNEFLWFLHADSKLPRRSIVALGQALRHKPEALHYFDLEYLNDGPAAMKFSELGSRLRSGVFQLPFGDQGFCIRREIFNELNGFNEELTYGEDHDFVWRAHNKKIPLNNVKATIFTSARKYQNNGWGFTTARQLVNTCTLAVPSCFKWMRERILP